MGIIGYRIQHTRPKQAVVSRQLTMRKCIVTYIDKHLILCFCYAKVTSIGTLGGLVSGQSPLNFISAKSRLFLYSLQAIQFVWHSPTYATNFIDSMQRGVELQRPEL